MSISNSNALATIAAGSKVRHGILSGHVQGSIGVSEVVGTDFDADGDIVHLVKVPSSALVSSLKLSNDDLDSGTDSVVNLGLYNAETKFTDNGTEYLADALIDEDFFAAASTALQAASADLELAFSARDIATADQPLWEALGLVCDPNVNFKISLTQTATVAGATTGSVKLDAVSYTVG